MQKMIIGIDAGKHTGVAVFFDRKLQELFTCNTYQLIEYLQNNKNKIKAVVMEDSKLQSYIWGKNDKSNAALGRHARNIGSVDGRVEVIKEACEHLEININCISPAQKGAKWKAEEFLSYFSYFKGLTNQHERDAAKCVIMGNYHLL